MSGVRSLDLERRLRLVEDLWDDIASEADLLPLTSAQRKELDKRLDRLLEAGPDGISAWDAIAEIRNRR